MNKVSFEIVYNDENLHDAAEATVEIPKIRTDICYIYVKKCPPPKGKWKGKGKSVCKEQAKISTGPDVTSVNDGFTAYALA